MKLNRLFIFPFISFSFLYGFKPFDQNLAYTHVDIVVSNGVSYITLQNVPAGTPITSTTYWKPLLQDAPTNDPGDPPATEDPTQTAPLPTEGQPTPLPEFVSSTASVDYTENSTGTVYVASAEDAVSYSISGDDVSQFSIGETTGVVTFNSTPDYENPSDNDTDNNYSIFITATNDTGSDQLLLIVTVTDDTDDNNYNFTNLDVLAENTLNGARSVWNLNGAKWEFQTEENLLSGGATVGTYSSSTIVFGSGDFDNDGNVDIAISDTSTGDSKIIFMNGNLEASQVNIGTLATTDKPVAVADFNSDGLIDIVTDNVASGLKKIHFLTGSGRSLSINSQVTVTTDSNYSIVGAADFDQDGNPDLLVEQITSDTDPLTAVARVIWLMDGYTIFSTKDVLPPFRQEWRMKGVGDFDNDQNIDIMVEQDGTGRKGIWYLNGTSIRDGFTYLTLQPDWIIGCSGDFNKDGSNDPVFYNLSSGKVIVLNLSNQSPEDNQWGNKYAFLNINTTFLAAGTQNAGTDWKMRGFIDYNGDNQLEILADNTNTGEKAIWQIDTTNALVSTVFASEPNWRMCATGSFGGDSTTDIVAENISTGEKQFWIMSYSGNNFAVSSKTTFANDLSFRIVGAGDFNDDNEIDLVLEYLTSSDDPLAKVKRKIWYFNGVLHTGEHEFLDFNQEWRMRGVIDYDNNGHPDILVEQDNMGRKGIWAMKGSSLEYGFTFTTVGPQWTFPIQ